LWAAVLSEGDGRVSCFTAEGKQSDHLVKAVEVWSSSCCCSASSACWSARQTTNEFDKRHAETGRREGCKQIGIRVKNEQSGRLTTINHMKSAFAKTTYLLDWSYGDLNAV
jgi:ribosomal protein S11